MSDLVTKKISELTEVSTMAATDYFPVNVDIGSGVFKTRRIDRDAVPFPSGVLSYVDAEDGDDATALRGDFKKRFATPLAAAAAASVGDTIVVFPGSYNVAENIARNGVNWHLMYGATLVATGSASAIFDDSPSGLNADMIFKVTGEGAFTSDGSSGNARPLFMGRSFSSVDIECDSLFAYETSVFSVGGGTLVVTAMSLDNEDIDASGELFTISNGTVTFNIDDIQSRSGVMSTVTGSAALTIFAKRVYGTVQENQQGIVWSSSGVLRMYVQQDITFNHVALDINSGTAIIHCEDLTGGSDGSANSVSANDCTLELHISDSFTGGYTSGDTLNAVNATVRIECRTVQNFANSFQALDLSGTTSVTGRIDRIIGPRNACNFNTSGDITLEARTVTGATDITGSGITRLVGWHATGIDNFGNREPFLLGPSANAIFQNCVGVAVGAATYGIDATGSVSARIYGTFNSNLYPDGTITFIVGASQYLVDSDVI